MLHPLHGHSVDPVTAYDELSTFQVKAGKGYDKRSVEQFRALALGIVDELMRESTVLRDQLAATPGTPLPVSHGAPMLTADEESVLARYRSVDVAGRQAMITGHFASPPLVDVAPQLSLPPAASSATNVVWGFDKNDPAPSPSTPALALPNTMMPMPATFSDVATDDVPEWMTAVAADPEADRSANWFLDGEFGGNVPAGAYGIDNRSVVPQAWGSESGQDQGTPLDGGWTAAVDGWPIVTESPSETTVSSSWDIPDVSPDEPLQPLSSDPWANAPTSWPSAAIVPAAHLEVVPDEPVPAALPEWAPAPVPADSLAGPMPSWTPPADDTSTLSELAGPMAFPAPMVVPTGWTEEPAEASAPSIDALFDQLDFGPPSSGVLDVATRLADPGPPAPLAGSPLHVDRPALVGAALPEPVAPWSGWIAPS